jgi:hypothetical protein
MHRSVSDVAAGLIFIAFGLAFALGAATYDIGTPVRMGPGFFPLVVGGSLAAIGGLIVLKPMADGDATVPLAPSWRAIILIIGAIAVFGVTVRGLGLVPSVFLTALLATLASRQMRPWLALPFAVGLTLLSVLIFVVGLSLRLPLLGPWIPRV